MPIRLQYAPTNLFGPCPYRDCIMYACSMIRPSIDGPTYDKERNKMIKIKYQNRLEYVNAIATFMQPTLLLFLRNTPSNVSLLKKREKMKTLMLSSGYNGLRCLSVLRGCHLLFHHLAHFLLKIVAGVRSGLFDHAGNLVRQFDFLLTGLENKLLDGVC